MWYYSCKHQAARGSSAENGTGVPTTLRRTKTRTVPLQRQLIYPLRLLGPLAATRGRDLVLSSAPADSWGTTLAAEWLQARARPAAWLSLDQEDNDPARFWAYVSRALGGLGPASRRAIGATLASPRHPSPRQILPALSNELLAIPETLALVLDDCPVIDNAEIYSGVELPTYSLPSNTMLFITGCSGPFRTTDR